MFESFRGLKAAMPRAQSNDLCEILQQHQGEGNIAITVTYDLLEKIDERMKQLSLELLSASQGGSWGAPVAPAGDVTVNEVPNE